MNYNNTYQSYNYELQEHNPWWLRPELINNDSHLIELGQQTYQWQPKIFSHKEFKQDAIYTLRGPRRVGKTTYLKILIKKLLLEDKLKPESVFLYNCDLIASYKELRNLIKEYLDFVKPRVKARLYLFLDEISFVDDWPRAIKSLVDEGLLKNSTLFITGSNILDLKFSSERMPGRRGKVSFLDKYYLPLSFKDFVTLVKPDLLNFSNQELFIRYQPILKKLLDDYILTGGFLANLNIYYKEKFLPVYLYEIYLSWIEGDLHKIKHSEKIALKISEKIYSQLTTPMSYNHLARDTGISSYITAEEYLEIMERMFTVYVLEYFDIDQKKVFSRKNKKSYFTNPFIMGALLSKARGFMEDPYVFLKKNFLNNNIRPVLAELFTADVLKRNFPYVYFGQSKKQEIDFVTLQQGEYKFFEVKYQNKISLTDIKKYSSILGNKKITLVTKNDFQITKNYSLVPLEIFLLRNNDFIY